MPSLYTTPQRQDNGFIGQGKETGHMVKATIGIAFSICLITSVGCTGESEEDADSTDTPVAPALTPGDVGCTMD